MTETRFPRIDHRPKWLRESQNLLKNTKEKHRNATQRLQDLSTTTRELSNKIDDENLLKTKYDKDTEVNDGSQRTETEASFCWRWLCTDIYGKICEFLLLREVVNLEAASVTVRSLSMESLHWLKLASYNVNNTGDARKSVLNKAKIEYNCMKFLKFMKTSRSVPRNKSIEPRRHSRMEKSVTHPMPIFENSTSEKVMSSTDTLDSEMRCEILSSLSDMSILTSDELDPASDTLIAQGAVTVSEHSCNFS